MIIHHIAVATHDIELVLPVYRSLGYTPGDITVDAHRNVRICFVSNVHTRLELVQSLGDNSPVSGILQKNPQDSVYHVCYEVHNLQDACSELKKSGFTRISPIEAAPAIDNRNVAFLFHSQLGVIELVEDYPDETVHYS